MNTNLNAYSFGVLRVFLTVNTLILNCAHLMMLVIAKTIVMYSVFYFAYCFQQV